MDAIAADNDEEGLYLVEDDVEVRRPLDDAFLHLGASHEPVGEENVPGVENDAADLHGVEAADDAAVEDDVDSEGVNVGNVEDDFHGR